jgi:hypothetical protein
MFFFFLRVSDEWVGKGKAQVDPKMKRSLMKENRKLIDEL